MVFNADSHALITKTRLLLSPPETVYQALREYGEHLNVGRNRIWEKDEALENALAQRDDRLINLGLAKYAGTADIVANSTSVP